MKVEALLFAVASLTTAALGDGRLPPEQALFLWSFAGTVTGAAVASLGMQASTTRARLVRAAISFLAGLLAAPWAIESIPRAASAPAWWHAFAASGIGASLVYVAVAESPGIVRALLRARVDAVSRERGRASCTFLGWLVLTAGLALSVAACVLPTKPADFCNQQPASVDKIIAAQERGVMTHEEIEIFGDLLWIVEAQCGRADGADKQAALSNVQSQLEALAQMVGAR